MTDPVANLLTILRNASSANLEKAVLPDSRFSRSLLQVFQAEGFIKAFRPLSEKGKGRRIEVVLAYGAARERLLNGARRISRPGRRVYVSLPELKPMLRKLEVPILSTSRGIMTGAQAIAGQVGGELVCVLW